ncbi:type IVB secretion system protein IcmX [Legionella israelensis]|uniref:type IVB secretion system protein IcmX n=1 Tax=Legionella israelensis TaxID=454 RepID=UPI0014320F0F|nr:type IVB secretion system protein IcmX [Legionella israelensis]
MKLLCKLLISGSLLSLTVTPVYSQTTQDGYDSYYEQQTSSNTRDLVKYLFNLGLFLGYNLSTPPSQQNVSDELLDPSGTQLKQNYLYNSVLGAIPVNAFSQAFSIFVPSAVPISQSLNAFANYTFKSQQYSSPQARQQGNIAVSNLIDQQNYQQDPVSQAVLNILATPDFSYCLNYQGTQLQNESCQLLYQNKVMTNIIGTLPGTHDYFTYDYNQKFLSQLNSNNLLSPLLYSTQVTGTGTNQQGQGSENPGLTANSQAQQAANFILYASGMATPPNLPKLQNYDTLYQQASGNDKSVSKMAQLQAQAAIASYFANLRVYAAQTSVGLSNLYYILSKRMPQNFGTDSENNTSQALNEFNMATWRLYKPQSQQDGVPQPNQQWINMINKASSATVQKEIAVLLAEINYQLYLNRQQQERILLTNSINLLQNTKASEPTQSSLGFTEGNTGNNDTQ